MYFFRNSGGPIHFGLQSGSFRAESHDIGQTATVPMRIFFRELEGGKSLHVLPDTGHYLAQSLGPQTPLPPGKNRPCIYLKEQVWEIRTLEFVGGVKWGGGGIGEKSKNETLQCITSIKSGPWRQGCVYMAKKFHNAHSQ